MPARSFAVIFNPVAGSRRAGRELRRLRAALEAAAVPFEIILTERPRHAAILTREAAPRFDAIIAAGGDGTLNEVATGLFGTERIALGVIPLGTGNDFAELLGVSKRPEEALKSLLWAEPVAIDAGVVRWREEEGGPWYDGLFLNALGIGFDAMAAAETARFKRLGGKKAYFAGILSALAHWPEPTVTVERLGPSLRIQPDGKTVPAGDEALLHRGPLFLAAVGNGRTVGGGFRLAPYASVTDGLLDLCFVEAVKKRRLAVLIPQVLRGRHLAAPEVLSERLPGLRVVSTGTGLPLHFDGEVLTRRAVEVEVHVAPGALRVLCPDPSREALRLQ